MFVAFLPNEREMGVFSDLAACFMRTHGQSDCLWIKQRQLNEALDPANPSPRLIRGCPTV